MFLSKKLNMGAGTPATTDPQFNYVTMLLHGDGTNGAQNNTFLDSSSNAFTVTRSGNVTQGSFSPYGSNWSNNFNGSSDYLSSPANTALNMGTGNWTIECWVYISSRTLNYPLIFGNNNGGYSAGALALTNSNNDSASYYDKFFLAAYDVVVGGPTLVSSVTNSSNTWYHLAVVRNGTNLTMYRNGTSVASNTISAGISFDWGKLGTRIGGGNWDGAQSYFNGYISNLRVVKGTAVYTSAFTPSTTPLTAITNTSLLTCQSNRFIDNSSNAFTVTPSGTPSVQRFNPFGTATAYSTSVIGGSGYFDGAVTYDKLQTTGTVGIASSAFTICCWFYPLNSSVIGLFDSGPLAPTVLRNYDANSIEQQGGTRISFAGSYKVNAWNWMCITKSSTSFTVYVNGVSQGTGACAATLTESTFTVGVINTGNDGAFYGYISDFQVLNTATVVGIPTAPITNASGKTFLLNFQNGAIFDNAMINDLETVGNAQISTSVVKYGTGSINCSTSSDYLKPPNSYSAAVGTGDFTIEFWYYASTLLGSYQPIFDTRDSGASATGFFIGLNASNKPVFYTNAGDRCLNGSAISTGIWYHIAVCRASGSTKLFVNGTQGGSTYTDTNNYSNQILRIGTNFENTIGMYGFIDDLRITKGYARYTANFTPPTAAFFNTGPY